VSEAYNWRIRGSVIGDRENGFTQLALLVDQRYVSEILRRITVSKNLFLWDENLKNSSGPKLVVKLDLLH
jgi:hypothetical protein